MSDNITVTGSQLAMGLVGILTAIVGSYFGFVINSFKSQYKEMIEAFREHRKEQIATMTDVYARISSLEKCAETTRESIAWIKKEHDKNHE